MSKQKEGIDYPKYVNHDYFYEINTERKAYFLGLLYADGNISIQKDNRQKVLTIALQEEDGYLLNELCKDVNPTKNITIQHSPSAKKKNWKKKAVFKVSSNKICNKLIELGCIQKKSTLGMNFDFSKLNEDLINHFIRGFFDGDGCLYVKNEKNKYKRITTTVLKKNFTPKIYKKFSLCCTTENFLKEILKILQLNCNLVSKPQWIKRTRTKDIYILKIEGQKDIKQIEKYLYKNATIFMKRKFNKFNMTISSQATNIFVEGSETT